MKMEGSFEFEGSRAEAWEILQDPDVLKAAIPHTKSMELIGPDEYATVMQVKLGPLAANFNGNVKITDKVEPERYTMNVEAKAPIGFGKGAIQIRLEEKSPEVTVMTYDGDLQVGGKLASLGQRLLDTVAKSVSKQALNSLNDAIKAKAGEQNA
ncbi:MAG: carbon monoxide dehydrogenase subunit G [Verrucomicrobia bacterium]|nr:carbon monoxide dehydrogenase subunit G [Verrucomicrobiota bacterium]